MTKQETKTAPSCADLADLFSINGAASDIVAQMTQKCGKDLLECQSEVAKFVSDRWNSDLAFQKSLAACKNIADIAQAQQAWMSQMIHDYSAQAARLSDLIQASARDNLSIWTKAVSAPPAGRAGAPQTRLAAE